VEVCEAWNLVCCGAVDIVGVSIGEGIDVDVGVDVGVGVGVGVRVSGERAEYKYEEK
jgi:hypothetical protein